MNSELCVRFTEVLLSDSPTGERSRYLVGAKCPKLAFFYAVGLKALGGEFRNDKMKLFHNSFGTHIIFPRWEGVINVSEMSEEELKDVEEALPQYLDVVFV